MPIDITSLTYEELLELKHVIVERLRHLDSIRPQNQVLQFRPGDEVNFGHQSQGKQTGTLLDINEKAATVITRSGQKWKVSPKRLRKVIKPKVSTTKTSKITEIRTKENDDNGELPSA